MLITLELTEAEVDYILKELGKNPFNEVNEIIFKIYNQGKASQTAKEVK